MADFNVSTMFKAIDKVSKVFGKQSRAATMFGDKTTRAFNKASRSGTKFGSVLKGVLGANIIGRGFGMIARGVRNVINEFVDFDDAVVSASAKFKGLNLLTDEGRQSLIRLKRTARDVGAATQFTSSQAARGLDFLALAGFNAEQAMVSLPGVVDLATVAQIDLGRSSDIATDALGAFGLMVKDTNQLQKNFTRLNDVMALTMSSTNTNIEDMFDAITKGAPTFIDAGQSLETFSAAVGIMADSGKKGGEAGTLLRNMMLRLANPTTQAQKILNQLNIETQDSAGNFRDAIDIIADLEKGMNGLGTAQRSAALDIIFGKKAITGISILMRAGADRIRGFRDELINAGGTSKKIADIMRESLGNRLKALQSASIELGFKFIEAFDKRGRKGINALTAAVREFDPKPVIEFLETSFSLFKSLFEIIKPILPFFPTIVKGLIAIKVAMIAVNIAMLANPAGIVIAGIGLLVFTLVSLALEWDSVVASFNQGISNISSWFKGLWEEIQIMGIKIFLPILKTISAIQGFLGFDTITIDALIVDLDQTKKDIKAINDLRNNRVDFNFPIPKTVPKDFVSVGKSKKTFINANGEFIVAPNQTEVESRQQIGFNGQIDITGAPAGTTVKGKTTGAPDINMNLAGANP